MKVNIAENIKNEQKFEDILFSNKRVIVERVTHNHCITKVFLEDWSTEEGRIVAFKIVTLFGTRYKFLED
jgi:hypothetical protein